MKHTLLALAFVALAAARAPGAESAAAPGAAADGALLQVIVTFQQYDPFTPWQKTRPGIRQGYGVVVGKGRVLTTESLVRNQTMVELRRATSGDKIPATVAIADEQVDLALLQVADDGPAAALPALGLSTNVFRRRDKLTILQFDETRGVQRGESEVVQITMSTLPNAPFSALMYNLLTDLNVNGEGAAVVRDGSLAGLIIAHNSGERIGFMLPAPVLRRFLDDAAEPPYTGTAMAGFRWKSLVDPARRAYLRLNHAGQGIEVLSCVRGTGADRVLKPNDVILDWQGAAIDSLGFYDDAVYGRLSLAHLISGKGEPGGQVPVTVWRDGQAVAVSLALASRDDRAALVPDNIREERPAYLVEGGFVLRELDGHYLRARGGDWKSKTDVRITNLYLTRRDNPEQPGDRIVLLSNVLPDPINIGFQEFSDQIVDKVNGKPVRRLADVFRIRDEEGAITRLTLRSVGVDLVIDRAGLEEANRRIARAYRLPELEYRPGKPAGER